MFDHDTNADDAVSRRNVLQTAGGLLAGSTALVGLGTGTGAAETEEGLRIEVREMNEAYLAVEVRFPDDLFDEIKPLNDVFLGHAERFVIHEDGEWVSLPEETEGLANPVEMDFGTPHDVVMYFRTRDVDLSEADGEEVTLGLGLFRERTIPGTEWDACPGHRDY
jgi:hypothetical protein